MTSLLEFEGTTHDLFLGVLVRRKQVHGLDMAEVDVVAEQEDEEQLANVLLLLVAVQRLVTLEFAPEKFCFFCRSFIIRSFSEIVNQFAHIYWMRSSPNAIEVVNETSID